MLLLFVFLDGPIGTNLHTETPKTIKRGLVPDVVVRNGPSRKTKTVTSKKEVTVEVAFIAC